MAVAVSVTKWENISPFGQRQNPNHFYPFTVAADGLAPSLQLGNAPIESLDVGLHRLITLWYMPADQHPVQFETGDRSLADDELEL